MCFIIGAEDSVFLTPWQLTFNKGRRHFNFIEIIYQYRYYNNIIQSKCPNRVWKQRNEMQLPPDCWLISLSANHSGIHRGCFELGVRGYDVARWGDWIYMHIDSVFSDVFTTYAKKWVHQTASSFKQHSGHFRSPPLLQCCRVVCSSRWIQSGGRTELTVDSPSGGKAAGVGSTIVSRIWQCFEDVSPFGIMAWSRLKWLGLDRFVVLCVFDIQMSWAGVRRWGYAIVSITMLCLFCDTLAWKVVLYIRLWLVVMFWQVGVYSLIILLGGDDGETACMSTHSVGRGGG